MLDAALGLSSPLSPLSEQSSSDNDIPLAVQVKWNAKAKAAAAKEVSATMKAGKTKKAPSKSAPKNATAGKSKNTSSKDSTVKVTTRSSKGKEKAVPVTRKNLRFADVDEVF